MNARYLPLLVALTACKGEPKFYCFSAGNEVGRECLETESRCEEGFDGKGDRACFAQERAYCLSVSKVVSGDDGYYKATGERTSVCAPTPQECEAFRADYQKLRDNYRRPSACVEASHKEIWP